MAWWQKKLLRFALAHTGLLDDTALALDDLDMAWGKKNVVDLKNVGLNIQRISKLAQLPSCLRVETARVLSLRLTVPADIYQSGIVAELDGVRLDVVLDESLDSNRVGKKAVHRSGVDARSPQHRKVNRRLHSPMPHDPGGPFDPEDDHIPTTEELAKSFLLEEPVEERRDLEASVAAGSGGLEESIVSESSDGDEYGTGVAIGLPGFLAGFLTGIVDRLQVHVKDIELKLRTTLSEVDEKSVPLELVIRVGSASFSTSASTNSNDATEGSSSNRCLDLREMTFAIKSDAGFLDELSAPPSPPGSRKSARTTSASEPSASIHSSVAPSRRSLSPTSAPATSDKIDHRLQLDGSHASSASRSAKSFGVASGAAHSHDAASQEADLEIQPGDDNISWGSRRSQSSMPAENLWSSMVSEDELPHSLLLDRAPTPRVPSSGADSPASRRESSNDRDSPPIRQSPGSWPMMEESLHDADISFGSGSVPVIQHNLTSSDRDRIGHNFPELESSTDNKKVALEQPVDHALPLAGSFRSTVSANEDLSTSRMFSHEEAQSMYMSAISHRSDAPMPGGWNSGLHNRPSATTPLDHSQSSLKESSEDDIDETHSDPAETHEPSPSLPEEASSGNVTPRPQTPEISPAPEQGQAPRRTSSLQILHVDSICILLPTDSDDATQPVQSSFASSRAESASLHRAMPGTFSEYSDLAASRRKLSNSMTRDPRITASNAFMHTPKPLRQSDIAINVGAVSLQLDFCTIRLGNRLVTTIVKVLEPSNESKSASTAAPTDNKANPALTISVEGIKFDLRHQIDLTANKSAVSPSLLSLECRQIKAEHSASAARVCLGRLALSISGRQTMSLRKSTSLDSSTTITAETPDVEINAKLERDPGQRNGTYLTVATLPIAVIVDVPVIEDVLDSVGGLSAMLEAGSSVLSESGLSSPQISPSKASRGVRFTDEPSPSLQGHEIKADCTIGGLEINLITESCSAELFTTKIKATYREQGNSGATFSEMLIQGPRLRSDTESPVTLRLTTCRLEFASAPQDKDLERLLALLTPSRDKYDNDDDILVETLLRQRKKGAVARISVGGVELDLRTLDCVGQISLLSNDLKKISAVAKYLPEDERPGLLTLIRLKEIEVDLPVNERFGRLHVGASELHCAHVGIPSLLALSIDSLTASQAGGVDLVHPLVGVNVSGNLPMIMARMLGNEMEPVVKVKLFNICAEYSVPTILALTNTDKDTDAEQLVSDLTKSVAALGITRQSSGVSSNSSGEASDSLMKKTKIELLIHDSAIGLSPQKSTAKALLVMTDVRFSTLAPPPSENLTASVELRKAAVFLADQVNPHGTTLTSVRGSPHNSATKAQLMLALYKQGFVSVGSILAATIKMQAKPTVDKTSKVVEVDVGSQLLLLETCADSTQTLIALLGQLTPPTPPTKQPKYLTEPMTIDDMMASFSGDAYIDSSHSPEKIFDAEDDQAEYSDTGLTMPGFDNDTDDLLLESEMSASLYGPVSGIMSTADVPDSDESFPDEMTETVESLLEDDPFEMPLSPTDTRLSDSALIRDLKKQSRRPVSDKTVDLGIYEIEDLGLESLNGARYIDGTQHRVNAPTKALREGFKAKQGPELPFQLRVRDVHIIWNIYDGYDWQRTREGITQAVEQVEIKAEERKARQRQRMNDLDDDESVIGDFLFNSIYIGVPSNLDAQEIRRQINRGIDDQATETESAQYSGMSRPTAHSSSPHPSGTHRRRRLKLERSRTHKIAFELKGLSADVLAFPTDSSDAVGSIDVRVRDFEIFDNVPTSTWRKFLTHSSDGPESREMSKPMMHIEVLKLRTLENFSASELALHVSVLPLRLHVDQDALDFITRFFEFKDTDNQTAESPGEQPFLQRIEIDTVDLCLDYKPKKIDYAGLRSGHTTEFMNIVILDAANIRLRHAIVYGIKGFEPLHKTLNDVWMPDIKRNQLATVLAGLAPARSLVNIATGVRDVVAIPIQEYRKDGRLVRSIQKGAFHFGKTTTSELARLGAKVAIGTQTLLQGAEGLLSPQSASTTNRPDIARRVSSEQGWYDTEEDEEAREQRAISAYADQPLGVLSGLRSARRYLERDLLTARDALIAVQGEVLQSSGPADAAVAVARAAPTVIIRPVSGVSRAVGTALLGVSNQIDRSNVRRIEDKYKKR